MSHPDARNEAKPVNMPITREMLDCKVQGVKRKVTFSVRGNITGTRLEKDENGVEKEVREYAWGPITVTVTIDYTGLPLRMLFDDHASRSNGLSVYFQANRSKGLEAMQALDGQTFLMLDLLTNKGNATPAPVKAFATIDKIKDPVQKEQATLDLIKMLEASLKSGKQTKQ